MVIHPCAKYGKPMSIQKKVMGRTRKHVKTPINFTLRSNFKVVSGSWMFATHRLMVIHPCAKYGKPMSNHKKVMGRTRICTEGRTDRRTDRRTQTDRQSDFYIPPWTSFAGGIINWQLLKIFFSRTTGPITTKLGTKHPRVKGSHVCSIEGPRPFSRGDNYEIVKIHWQN